MRTFFFSDLAHCLNFFSKGYDINIISESAFIGSRLYPTNKVVNNVEIPLIEINGMQFTTLETLFERLESMGIHYKPFIKLPWTTAYPFFREGEKWYPYPILTKNGEVFVAYTKNEADITETERMATHADRNGKADIFNPMQPRKWKTEADLERELNQNG